MDLESALNLPGGDASLCHIDSQICILFQQTFRNCTICDWGYERGLWPIGPRTLMDRTVDQPGGAAIRCPVRERESSPVSSHCICKSTHHYVSMSCRDSTMLSADNTVVCVWVEPMSA